MIERNSIEMPFSLSEIGQTISLAVQDQIFRMERSFGENVLAPINNFLKSSDEIESEFSEAMNSYRTSFEERMSPENLYNTINNRDGYLNTQVTGNTGFLEENY